MKGPGDSGVVLLNALILISVVAAIAAALIRDDLEARNRYALMQRSDQARVFAQAAEALTLRLLTLDAEANEVDHLGEAWAEPARTFDIEGAVLKGRIHDLQGRLNVNQILTTGEAEAEADGPVVSAPEMAVLAALIERAGGPPTLAPRVAEWLTDAALDVPGAAGDAPYLRRATPALRAAAPALAVRDLRGVDGMTAALFDRLEGGVTALPERVPINVNTASRTLLEAMMPGLRPAQMERLLRQRLDTPFRSRAAFETYVARIVPPAVLQEIAALDLDVTSHWFLLEAEVTHGPSRARLFSIIHRPETGRASVHLRSSAPL